jgi:UDP-glucose 4-epimerase
MKILITGVAGLIGSRMADWILENHPEHEVIGIDNLSGGYKNNVHPYVKFYEIDCKDKGIKDIFETHKPDYVYHFAAYAAEGLSPFIRTYNYQNNLEATANIVNECIKHDVKRLVFTSTMAVYGHGNPPFDESHTPAPIDPYGIAKYASELTIKNLCEMHEIEFVISVPHNIIGPRQKYDDPFRNVASIMINLMLQGRQPFIYGDGEQKRCFSFINDVTNPLMKIGFQEGLSGEVINIGPDEGTVSINGLAQTIAKLINFKLDPIYKLGRPLEVKNATCSADKARKLLDYKTNYTLEQGLQEMIDYI